MRSALNKFPWKALGLGMSVLAISVVLASWANSDSNRKRLYVPKNHETSHVHDHADLSWPPQPREMNDVVDYSRPDEAQLHRQHKERRFADLERGNNGHANFKRALGRKYNRITFAENEDKYRPGKRGKYVYFSRDHNATVEVTSDGDQITGIKSTPAGEYQPEITPEEIAEATQIAKKYFIDKGLSQAAELQGFGILAYPSEGKTFYQNRVIYITLHKNLDAPPEMMAWVDLTNGSVLKSREEKQ